MDPQAALRIRDLIGHYKAQLPRMGEVPALRLGFGGDLATLEAAAFFAQVHCVDFFPEACTAAARLAVERTNIFVHSANRPDLRQFRDGSFQFAEVSRRALQADREWTVECLRSCARVLDCGGLLQLEVASNYATLQEIIELIRRFQLQTLSFEGPDRHGLFHGLLRRMPMNWREELTTLAGITQVEIRKITNAVRPAPIVPCRGTNATIAVFVKGLPEEPDLFDLVLLAGGVRANLISVGPADSRGVKQLIAQLPEMERTGLVPVELFWMMQRTGRPGVLRVSPQPPEAPRLVSLVAGRTTGSLAAIVEDLANPESFAASVDGKPAWGYDYKRLDPDARRFEILFELPDGVMESSAASGGYCNVTVRLGRRELPPVPVSVTPPVVSAFSPAF